MAPLRESQLTGRDEGHLQSLACGHRLQPLAAQAFQALRADARAAGFDLAIASSFRSFDRQLAIWNGKAAGERPVHDDRGRRVDIGRLSAEQRVHAILRYSALPGTSRHHWGTDLDVYDAAALPDNYQVQLSPGEVAPGGLFDGLHRWLDERMGEDASHGFYRPYALDRGGVAPERWHLSYAPLSLACAGGVNGALLRASWDQLADGGQLLLREVIEQELPLILARYVEVPAGWCPQS